MFTVIPDPFLGNSFTTAEIVRQVLRSQSFNSELTASVAGLEVKEIAAITYIKSMSSAGGIVGEIPYFALPSGFERNYINGDFSIKLMITNTNATIVAGIKKIGSLNTTQPASLDEIPKHCDQFKLILALQNTPINISFEGLPINSKYNLYFQAQTLSYKNRSKLFSELFYTSIESNFGIYNSSTIGGMLLIMTLLTLF